uniref:Immunoglobulin V-set domain-containing protein n=1 Tax=Pundamilia nyererei TaxID=303518 RepID=A0A3B4F820_9CICH
MNLLIMILGCTAPHAVGVIHVTGYVGSIVKVSCSYDEGYESYEKYLCKNNCGDSDVLVTTLESRKNKYRIHDDKTARIFTTTISDLHLADAGKYWCGVTRTGKDIYTELCSIQYFAKDFHVIFKKFSRLSEGHSKFFFGHWFTLSFLFVFFQ